MNIIGFNKNNHNSTTIKWKNNIPYISYKALENIPWLTHGFSTRMGGVSTDYLSSMNLGSGRGDSVENVIKNHELIAGAIGFDAKNIVAAKQTHTTNVKVASKTDRGKGVYFERDYDDIDGLITNEKNIVLATYYADCVPLFIVDTKNKAIGLSHSGWRGTVSKMGKVTIEKMTNLYGTNPKDVIACIGPSICQSCYEISKDVADEFIKAFPKDIDQILIEKPNDKYLLDLWMCNKLIFKEAGVLDENIHMPDVCTCCNESVMFSHRASKGKRGNLAAFLELK